MITAKTSAERWPASWPGVYRVEYMTADLVKAILRAKDRGPKAEAVFRKRMDAAFERYKVGEKIEEAFFDLLADDPDGEVNS